jgi:hypothetical protein
MRQPIYEGMGQLYFNLILTAGVFSLGISEAFFSADADVVEVMMRSKARLAATMTYKVAMVVMINIMPSQTVKLFSVDGNINFCTRLSCCLLSSGNLLIEEEGRSCFLFRLESGMYHTLPYVKLLAGRYLLCTLF